MSLLNTSLYNLYKNKLYKTLIRHNILWLKELLYFLCTAPFAGGLGVYVTQRGVMMIGGTLAASGMIFASLGLGFPWMYLSVGVLQGSSRGLFIFCCIKTNLIACFLT